MPLNNLRPDEPLIDPRTGLPTKRFLGIIREINAILDGISFSDISGAISLAQLPAHVSTHKALGSDPIRLDELKAPTDVLTLNATITEHGLLPKLSGNAAHRLGGDGLWH